MPNRDKTGPEGKGSKTGRGEGDCAPKKATTGGGYGNTSGAPRGYGRGLNRGAGRGGR